MRLARLAADGHIFVGLIDGNDAVELTTDWVSALAAQVPGGPGIRSLESGRRWPLANCEFLKPLDTQSRGIFCIGLNYWEHADEFSKKVGVGRANKPPIFLKLASSVLDPYKPIVINGNLSTEIDWEIELGVVLGRGGRFIPVDRVGSYVAGYTIIVDMTARDLQREHGQWFIGKNSHELSPMGPWVVTVDELGFPPVTTLSLSVNGVEKQRSSSELMIVSISDFISMTSESIELQPGDVFATGSPPGVGFTRNPPEFLTPGDVLEATIDGVGNLVHSVV